MSLILAGDVGSTRARFALVDETGRKVLHQDVLESRTFVTFEAALARFLDGARAMGHLRGTVLAASFGIAGPVVDRSTADRRKQPHEVREVVDPAQPGPALAHILQPAPGAAELHRFRIDSQCDFVREQIVGDAHFIPVGVARKCQ